MTVTEIVDRKRALRGTIRARRRELGEDRRAELGRDLGERLRTLVHTLGARTVCCFLATASEPDTRPFLRWARSEGRDVLLPVSREDGRLDWIRAGAGDTVPGAFGIEEPVGVAVDRHSLAAVDLMLIPAAAVDLHGNRLGWGRGYFDRCIAELNHSPHIWAVVFDDEVFDAIPVEPHDSPVDGAVTPSRTLRFGDIENEFEVG